MCASQLGSFPPRIRGEHEKYLKAPVDHWYLLTSTSHWIITAIYREGYDFLLQPRHGEWWKSGRSFLFGPVGHVSSSSSTVGACGYCMRNALIRWLVSSHVHAHKQLSETATSFSVQPGKLRAGTWKSPVWKGKSFEPSCFGFKMLTFKGVQFISRVSLMKPWGISSKRCRWLR